MHIPNPKDAVEAAQQARVMERASEIALTLKTGGAYTASQQEAGVWGIYKRDGNLPDTSYLIDFNAGTCTCPFFEEAGYCKHYLGLQARLDEDARDEALEAQCAEIERQLQDAETAEGCDPFARY